MLTFEDENSEKLVEIIDAPHIKQKNVYLIKDINSFNGSHNEKEKKYFETIISNKLKGEEVVIDNKKKSSFNQMILNEGRFEYIPDLKRERDVILYLGMAGSGKSYQINQYLEKFRNTFKDWPIYLFSEKTEDISIKVPVKRIRLDQSLKQLKWEDFEETCCVFDDIDGLKKELKEIVYTLRDKMLKLGRQKRINVLMSNHNCTDGLDTKTALNEARVIVCFPANYNRSLKYLFESYVGLNKEQIKTVKSLPGRALYFLKTYPNIVISETMISLIKDL